MDIVLGATGRVGSGVAKELLRRGRRVRAVVRDAGRAGRLREAGAEVAVADYVSADAMRSALAGGETLFVVTPEAPASQDWLADAEAIFAACRAAAAGGIGKIVGLSSSGAQHAEGTGALMLSHRLEHAFPGFAGEQSFIRPSYYYSNWLAAVDAVRESGVLPTFLPVDFSVPMIAPADVAAYAAGVIAGEAPARTVHEISGPRSYAASEIADELGGILKREVRAQAIPPEAWLEVLRGFGFSRTNAELFADMTNAVLSGLTATEGEVVALPTGFSEYARMAMKTP